MKKLLIVVALLAACGPKTPVAAAPVPAPAEATAQAATPAPVFDEETLRQGFKVGTAIRYKITSEASGVVFQDWTVTAADDTGCTVHTKEFGADGVTLTDESERALSWSELSQTVGGQPPQSITRTQSSIDFAGQPLATVSFEHLYSDGTTITTHFAPSLVGPPVLVEMGAGDVVFGTLLMVSYTAP